MPGTRPGCHNAYLVRARPIHERTVPTPAAKWRAILGVDSDYDSQPKIDQGETDVSAQCDGGGRQAP